MGICLSMIGGQDPRDDDDQGEEMDDNNNNNGWGQPQP